MFFSSKVADRFYIFSDSLAFIGDNCAGDTDPVLMDKVLDFTDVMEIGQGFADEIFRVFLSQHPGIKIACINASPLVENMIKRAQ